MNASRHCRLSKILEEFMLRLLALNPIPVTDLILFIMIGVIVAIAVAVYFLIPVFNKKQYQEQRDNLHKREAAFKANLQAANGSASAPVEETNSETEQTTEQKAE